MPHWIPSTPETWPPPTPAGGLYPSPSVDPAPDLYPGAGSTSERWAPDTDEAWA